MKIYWRVLVCFWREWKSLRRMDFPLARSFEQFSKCRQVLSMLLNVARELSYWLSETPSYVMQQSGRLVSFLFHRTFRVHRTFMHYWLVVDRNIEFQLIISEIELFFEYILRYVSCFLSYAKSTKPCFRTQTSHQRSVAFSDEIPKFSISAPWFFFFAHTKKHPRVQALNYTRNRSECHENYTSRRSTALVIP